MVTLSQSQVEKLLSIIEESERCLLEARTILNTNASTTTAQSPSNQMTPSIEYINWRIKGGRSAGPNDEFAFDFTQDRNGKVSRDKAPVVDYIKQRGPFQANGYEVTLSKDGKFLQRKRV